MVAKGDLRMVVHAFIRPGRGTQFVRHLSCVTPELLDSCVSVYGSVSRVPVDVGKRAGSDTGRESEGPSASKIRSAVLEAFA